MEPNRDWSDLKDAKGEKISWEQYIQSFDVLFEALTAKYGKPYKVWGEPKPDCARWVGTDVILTVAKPNTHLHSSLFFDGDQTGVCLASLSAFQAAMQDLKKQSQMQEQDTKKKAQDPKLKDRI